MQPRGPHYFCPACNRLCYRLEVLDRHLRQCCPDLMLPLDQAPVALSTPEEWRQPSETQQQALQQALERARQAELGLRQQALRIAFTELTASGEPVKRDIGELSRRLQLPRERVAVMVRLALRAIPMPADEGGLQVLHEDEVILVVSKPPGMPTAPKHRWQGGTLVNRAISHLGAAPFPVHRLDQDTSGVIVLAKTSRAAAHLHAQFRRRSVRKEYLALVAGGFLQQQQCLTMRAPIGQHPQLLHARRCSSGGGGQPAATEVQLLASAPADLRQGAELAPLSCEHPPPSLDGVSLVAAEPQTGRTHQIRLHLADIGCPILGDSLYGVQTPIAPRQMLHAARLRLRHPADNRSMTFTAPLPPDFRAALASCGLDPDSQACEPGWD